MNENDPASDWLTEDNRCAPGELQRTQKSDEANSPHPISLDFQALAHNSPLALARGRAANLFNRSILVNQPDEFHLRPLLSAEREDYFVQGWIAGTRICQTQPALAALAGCVWQIRIPVNQLCATDYKSVDIWVSKRTPGRFRTRVLTDGVIPSLHVDYKTSKIKQYHKESRALRTETTINNTRDFNINKGLKNLPALREIGFRANRRLLDVQRLSHDCTIGEDAFRQVNEPVEVDGQRASALRFADPIVLALFNALLVFRLLPRGFSNRELRNHWAPHLGKTPQSIKPGQMTYHLRRLRLHGLIERVPKSHRYRVTDSGWKTILFCTRCYNRCLRPGMVKIIPKEALLDTELRRRFDQLDEAITQYVTKQQLAA